MAPKRCSSTPGGGDSKRCRSSNLVEEANKESVAAGTMDETEGYDGAFVTQDQPAEDDMDGDQRASVAAQRNAEEEEKEGTEAHGIEEGDVQYDDMTAAEARGRRRKSNSGKPSEAGVIKRIYCENFMCHQKYTVDLNRNVNFIHGQNGSGKSAILAAIQICLGAGARRTHRARNLKDLVRKDTTSGTTPSCAKVQVTLLNHGSDGYKNDLYGDTITVERTIALRGGFNGYKLLDANGKEQSRSKKDLDEMIDTLNIQVENPVSVLDQEEAKKFLMGDPKDKYDFFMKATDLARCDRTYASTLDTILELIDTNTRIEDSLEASKRNVAMLKEKWEEHQVVEDLRVKLRVQLSNCLWAKHREVEEEYNKAVKVMEKYQELVTRKQQEIAKAEEACTSVENDGNREKVDELLAEANNQSTLKRELEEELKAATAPYRNVKRQLSLIKKRQNAAKKTLSTAKQVLRDARKQILANAESGESEEARRTAILQQTEDDLSTAKGKVEELKQVESDWLCSYEKLESKLQDVSSKVGRVKEQLHGVKGTIARLQSSAANSIEIWGSRVAKVAKLVEQARRQNRFRGDVIGPVGSFIKITPGKEEYASIAEHAIGFNVLDRFVVTNDHDNAVMLELRREAGCKQDVGLFQIASTDRYRIPPPPEADGIETVASVLTISDALVFNCLVDHCRIDQRALARSKTLSEQQLLGMNGNQAVIRARNIKQVFFLPDGDQWEVKKGMHSIFSNEKKLHRTIGVDRRAAIAEAEREEEEFCQELQQLNHKEGRLQHEHANAQREWNRARKAFQENNKLIGELIEKIDEIKEEIENSVNVTIDTTEYETDVQQAEEVVESLNENEKSLKAKLEENRLIIDGVEKRISACNVRNEKVKADLEKAEAELSMLMESQTQSRDEIARKGKKLQACQEKLIKQKEFVKVKAETRDKALAKAREFYFRNLLRREEDVKVCKEPTADELEAIEPQRVNKDSDWYEVRIKNTKAKIEEESKRRELSCEDPAVALEKYTRAVDDLQHKAKSVRENQDTIEQLQLDIKKRHVKWEAFRAHLSDKADQAFDRFLSINGYSGSLDFNHNNKHLEIAVQKTSMRSQEGLKDIKALSGGEKSYATICLLFALGETVETPFRVLDEFDVFLDPQARKLAIKLLIKLAKRMENHQFIFITPQDLSNIKTDSTLRILKLADPRKHQDAGGPSQQTLNFVSQE